MEEAEIGIYAVQGDKDTESKLFQTSHAGQMISYHI